MQNFRRPRVRGFYARGASRRRLIESFMQYRNARDPPDIYMAARKCNRGMPANRNLSLFIEFDSTILVHK